MRGAAGDMGCAYAPSAGTEVLDTPVCPLGTCGL